jgi:hypothetical protein
MKYALEKSDAGPDAARALSSIRLPKAGSQQIENINISTVFGGDNILRRG